jgi:pilus assembly protein Flp/PilA
MEKFILATRRFLRDEEGATAIEYGLLAALISVAIIIVVTTVGENLNAVFDYIGGALGNAIPAGS